MGFCIVITEKMYRDAWNTVKEYIERMSLSSSGCKEEIEHKIVRNTLDYDEYIIR